jgi:CRP-like cAMP-binding protein
MFDWWLVRLADKTGKLTASEWTTLTVAGESLTIPNHAKSTWTAPHGGVIIVSQGAIRVTIRGLHSQHLMKLHAGDMTGNLQPFSCTVEALQPALVHCFSHHEWLTALKKMPGITQKLLNGMASSALRIEQTLSESA